MTIERRGVVHSTPRVTEFGECRQDVEQRGGLAHAAWRKYAGRRNDERDAAGRLEEAHLVPQTPLAQHVTVIGEQHDDCVVLQARVAQRRQQCAHLVVDVRHRAQVGAPRGPHLRRSGLLQAEADHVAQAPGMRVVGHRTLRDSRHGDVGILVAIPAGLRHEVGIVRMRQRNKQTEGPPVTAARDVEQFLSRDVDHFVVEIDLVGARA